MNRQDLKQAGKNLFKKNYWHSVLISFFMALGFSEGGGRFSYTTSSDESLAEQVWGGGDFEYFIEEFIATPISIAVATGLIALAVLSYLVFKALKCGGIRYFLKLRKNQPVEIKEVAENLKDKTYLNIAKVSFFKDLHIFLWSLLFVIPGIIKSYEYAAVDYILAVRPDIDGDEARRLSKTVMNGNKWDFFVLELSFLGWDILSGFTIGVLYYLYVNPYKQATYVEYFSDLRLQALAKGIITPNDIPDYDFYNPQPQYQPPNAQPENNFYSPQYNPIENNYYAPQQPVEEPVGQSFEQPITQPTESTVETPITEPVVESVGETEPTTEEPDDVM